MIMIIIMIRLYKKHLTLRKPSLPIVEEHGLSVICTFNPLRGLNFCSESSIDTFQKCTGGAQLLK